MVFTSEREVPVETARRRAMRHVQAIFANALDGFRRAGGIRLSQGTEMGAGGRAERAFDSFRPRPSALPAIARTLRPTSLTPADWERLSALAGASRDSASTHSGTSRGRPGSGGCGSSSGGRRAGRSDCPPLRPYGSSAAAPSYSDFASAAARPKTTGSSDQHAATRRGQRQRQLRRWGPRA